MDSPSDDYDASQKHTMIRQVIATFFSNRPDLSGVAIDVCRSLQLIETIMASILAPPGFHGMANFVLFATCAGRIARDSSPTKMSCKAGDRLGGFLSFLDYYCLIISFNLNEQTTNFTATKSHICRNKSAKIKQSSRIN